MRLKRKKEKGLCPHFKEICKTTECEMYDERMDRCSIDLTPYNLLLLKTSIDRLIESEK